MRFTNTMSNTPTRAPKNLPRGQSLLELPQFNKGTAFSWEERIAHGLLGLLPPHEETLSEQVARAYRAYEAKSTDLERHIYLRQLQDFNEILFYRLIMDYPAKMIPIIIHADGWRGVQKILRDLPQATRIVHVLSRTGLCRHDPGKCSA